MTQAAHHDLIARWSRAGAAFGSKPADASPDLERLLLDTARAASGDARLFTMAMTWLCKYGNLIAKYRLKRLILDELEPEYKPVLGLLLDLVKQHTGTDRFNSAIAECPPANQPAPLFQIERKNETFRRLAYRRASEVSRKWNLWTHPIIPKFDALRPPAWIIRMNPAYQERAYLKGDLRATILEELRHDPQAGASESELARRCCAERATIRTALDDLELAGRVERKTDRNRSRIVLSNPLFASPSPQPLPSAQGEP